jgi:hypothetical protein
MTAKKEPKPTLTLVVEYDEVDEYTMEGIKGLIEEAKNYGLPVKAELTFLPPTLNLL